MILYALRVCKADVAYRELSRRKIDIFRNQLDKRARKYLTITNTLNTLNADFGRFFIQATREHTKKKKSRASVHRDRCGLNEKYNVGPQEAA